MVEFDDKRALREEIQGMNDVRNTLMVQERKAEEQLGLAEAQLNALRKLRGFLDIEMNRKREILSDLEKTE